MLTLRLATLDDLDLLQHWDQQPHVIATVPNEEWDWEPELRKNTDWQEMLIAELNGRSIGLLQIMDPVCEETHYWSDIEENCRAIDIWIDEKENLGKGYGTQMMNLAIERCFTDPKVHTIWIDPLKSNTKVHRF
ncbi:MAG: GNAT family N-acetyltransferase [Balneolaceae bacterium]